MRFMEGKQGSVPLATGIWAKRGLALIQMVLAMGWIAAALALAPQRAQAQAVASLQLVPASVAGGSGASVTAVITLAAPAPTGGALLELGSSNLELAASVAQVLVPAGQNSVNVVVATNGRYRRYSGLAFQAAITARNPAQGATLTATLQVSAQALPTDVVPNPDTDLSGPRCAGEPGVLFNCASGPNSQCSFVQECSLGCQTRPTQGLSYRDICATTGPYPVVTLPKRVVGSLVSQANVQLPSAATAGSFYFVGSASTIAAAQTRTEVSLPAGATSAAMPLNTAAVNRVQFAPIDASIHLAQNINGSTFFGPRQGRAWLAVTPGTRAPAAITKHQLEIASLQGGQVGFGTTCINQLAPAPEVGAVNLVLSSSQTSVVRVGPASLTPGADCTGFAFETSAVAVTTNVQILAQLGTQTVSAPLQVTPTPAAARVSSFFADPIFVDGGSSFTATFVLDGSAPQGGFTVALSTNVPAALVLPPTVTIPAGSDRVSILIPTQPVAADTLVTIFMNPTSPGLIGQVTVRAPVSAPTLSSLSVSPNTVAGGGTATGSVTLTGAAQTHTPVLLSSSSSAVVVPPSVTVAQGASVATFPVTTQSVTANTVAVLSATLGSVTRLGSVTVTTGGGGGGGSLPAPGLVSPANDARFNAGQTVNFDWADVAGAAAYVIQIDDSNAFTNPLTQTQQVNLSQASVSGLPTRRLYWRVRALDAQGNPGAWSSVRQFRLR